MQALLIAASRAASIFAVCRDLADAPFDQTIRNALGDALPDLAELERRLNLSLATKLPKALLRKPRRIAIDLTLIPYHGQPLADPKEVYRSAPKSGTSHFHAYATAAVVHQGHRYTLALTHVEHGERMKPVVQRLLTIVRRRRVKIRFLLLDKGFFSVEVIAYLKRAALGFIIPAMGARPPTQRPQEGDRPPRDPQEEERLLPPPPPTPKALAHAKANPPIPPTSQAGRCPAAPPKPRPKPPGFSRRSLV